LLLILGTLLASGSVLFSQDAQEKYQKDLEEHKKKVEAINKANAEKKKELDRIKRENKIKEFINEGNRSLRAQRWSAAIASFDQAISMDDCEYKAHYGKGYALARRRRYSNAVTSYKKAFECNPNYTKAYYGAASSLRRVRKYDEAIELLNKALDLNPKYYKALYELGTIYLNNKQNYPQAVAMLKRATEADPSKGRAFGALGDAYLKVGQTTNALNAFESSVAAEPSARSYWRIAEIYNKRGNHAKAFSAAENGLKLKSSFGACAFEAGIAQKGLGDLQKALVYFNRALRDNAWKENAQWYITNIQDELKKSGE
jgi:tetratricopeptide (TPR) repeat protein